jgi:hypothetical protein
MATQAKGRTEPPYPPKPRQYQLGKYPEYDTPKYVPEHPEYHPDEEHHCVPKVECCGLPGKTQCRIDPVEVKDCLERHCYEFTKCHQPPCRPREKCPVTKDYKPEYAHKPEYAEILGKFKPGYGEDDFDRQINECLRIWPHCTIGKIWVGENCNYDVPLWTGTGVLVGCDLVLTSSHIAPWDRPGWWMRFAPGYSEGHYPFGSSYVVDIVGYPTSAAVDDFVVCKLYKPLGDKCGWMGTEGWKMDQEYTSKVWNMVGYSPLAKYGEVQLFDGDEKIKHVKNEGIFKLLDAPGDTWGWSGGVLWGWHHDCACVIGLLCGAKEELCIFIKSNWAGGPGMVDLVTWARTNWE